MFIVVTGGELNRTTGFIFGLGRGDGRWFSRYTGITRRLAPFGFFNALFSGCRVKSGSLARISSYLFVSISWIVICLFVWITVAVGVEEEFVDGDDDELIIAEEIWVAFVVVIGIGDGDEFVVFTGEERIWNFSCNAKILLPVIGRVTEVGVTLA